MSRSRFTLLTVYIVLLCLMMGYFIAGGGNQPANRELRSRNGIEGTAPLPLLREKLEITMEV